MSWRKVVTIGLSCGVMTSLVTGAEQKIMRAEVPSAVLNAVAARYPKARMMGFEKESEGGMRIARGLALGLRRRRRNPPRSDEMTTGT
jgi:hypothetical protein